MRVEKNLRIPMRDGIELTADLFRPDTDDPVPALLAYQPYGKEIQSMDLPPQNPGEPLNCFTIEAGDVGRIVNNGYAHLIVDVRGTGGSGGVWANAFSRQEQLDGYHVVEWMAAQPWCDGNVGMVGISYLGIIQYLVAATRPPHLKAIFAYNALADFYRDNVYHGGQLDVGFYNPYLWSLIAVNAAEPGTPVEDRDTLRRRALDNPDIAINPFLYGILHSPNRNPMLFDFLLNPHDGPFYRERSACAVFDRIEIPTFIGASWDSTLLHLPGAFQAWAAIKAPKKMLLGPANPQRPWREYHSIMLRWYDHWLKGHDTGLMGEPPILMSVPGQNRWRWEQEWPLDRAGPVRFFLRGDGRLDVRKPSAGEKPDTFTQQPPHLDDAISVLRYDTAPLDVDLEVTGPVTVVLHADIDHTDANWIVRLKQIDSDGESVLTQGFLKASHRAIDPTRATPGSPYHPHTAESVAPVEPGRVHEYAIAMVPTCHVFPAGSQIRLEVCARDFSAAYGGEGFAHRFQHLPSSTPTTHHIHHTPEWASYLELAHVPPDGIDRGYHGVDPRT